MGSIMETHANGVCVIIYPDLQLFLATQTSTRVWFVLRGLYCLPSFPSAFLALATKRTDSASAGHQPGLHALPLLGPSIWGFFIYCLCRTLAARADWPLPSPHRAAVDLPSLAAEQLCVLGGYLRGLVAPCVLAQHRWVASASSSWLGALHHACRLPAREC